MHDPLLTVGGPHCLLPHYTDIIQLDDFVESKWSSSQKAKMQLKEITTLKTHNFE